MVARIYCPTRTAMQSGKAKSHRWVLEYIRERGKLVDSVMGWTGSSDTLDQVRLRFPTCDAAVSYARCHDISYEIVMPQARRIKLKSYADSFSYRG